jgi:hypothetical protein
MLFKILVESWVVEKRSRKKSLSFSSLLCVVLKGSNTEGHNHWHILSVFKIKTKELFPLKLEEFSKPLGT